MNSRNVIIRVTGFSEDVYRTHILEEANRSTYDEAIQFVKAHPHNNITWKIKPVINDLLMV